MFPQEPQLFVSVKNAAQKALAPVPHASGVAAGQAHSSAAHCWPTGHAWPQEPQFSASCVRLAQYVGELVGHLVSPVTHVTPQTPPAHSLPAAHWLPQEPQLFVSVKNAAQKALAPVPHASGVEAGHEHVLPPHCCPTGQVWPHAPQLVLSLTSSAQ
jgi:hypothetical protein